MGKYLSFGASLELLVLANLDTHEEISGFSQTYRGLQDPNWLICNLFYLNSTKTI